MPKLLFLATSAVAALASTAANASVSIEIDQIGNDVMATTSGSLNLTGLSYFGGANQGTGISSAGGYLSTGFSNDGVSGYRGISGNYAFGTGGYADESSDTGVGFVMTPYEVFVYGGYVSGGSLAGTATFANTTLAALGLTSGSRYVITAPHDTITIHIDSVPEPASWALFIGGFGLIGGAMRRRRASVSFA